MVALVIGFNHTLNNRDHSYDLALAFLELPANASIMADYAELHNPGWRSSSFR
jgi:hypothetical protein